jgi:hypothetical protein
MVPRLIHNRPGSGVLRECLATLRRSSTSGPEKGTENDSEHDHDRKTNADTPHADPPTRFPPSPIRRHVSLIADTLPPPLATDTGRIVDNSCICLIVRARLRSIL